MFYFCSTRELLTTPQADFDVHPVTRGRQIILAGCDGHTAWVSPTTLAINAPYPDKIEGGVIVRDENGEPTGENAVSVLRRFLHKSNQGCSSILRLD